MATTKATLLAHGQAGSIVSGTFADARISSSSVTQHATSYDDKDVKTDIAIVALNQASDHSKAVYDLNDQVIDTFADATGIDASSSTNEVLKDGHYSGYSEGLSFRYIKLGVTAGTFSGTGYDANAGLAVMNFDNGTGTAGMHLPDSLSTGGMGGISGREAKTKKDADGYFAYTLGGGGQTTSHVVVDYGQLFSGVTKLYTGKHRSNGSALRVFYQYSTDDTTYYDVPMYDQGSNGMSYNDDRAVNNGSGDLTLSRHDINELNMTDGSGAGYVAYSSIIGGFNWGTKQDLTLVSTSNTASSAPTKGDLVIMMENANGTATLNTDIKGYISRNGGSNWTQGTLVDAGSWGTNKKTLAIHDLDISSQPSGTAVRYKITTHNQATAKVTKIHGVSLGWK